MTTHRAALRATLSAFYLAAAFLALGCENDRPPNTYRQPFEVASLPEEVRESAKKALPGVTFQDAWKNLDSSTKALHSYEIRGRASNGKVREVRVSPSGEILEME
jgi:hypothetical protein